MADKKQQSQPIPIESKKQTQPVQSGSPQHKEVFDPEKSRAMRHDSTKSSAKSKTAEHEERLRLEGESEPPASMIGGVSGRPMSRRETKLEAVRDDAADTPAADRMTGTNRSPKIMEKNRKRRAA